MKTITFFKRVLASAALVSVCGFACATNNGKQFIHNDTMEGGKLVCREIYAMNDAASGILNPVKMYKYSYDTDQQKNSEIHLCMEHIQEHLGNRIEDRNLPVRDRNIGGVFCME